jgi:alanine-glyoxylate transaminase / serine-glyoxylate transaminase / serine-pyruvate transaminase
MTNKTAKTREMPTFNTRQRGWNFLQTPGPTNIPNRVLNAMNQPAVEFLGPEFMDFARGLFDALKPLFGTAGDIVIYAANGHGSWEAALTNTLDIGDKVLIPETGRFALSWGDFAGKLGVEYEVVENDWRKAVNPDAIEDKLRADTDHEIKAILLVHTDTGTGITSDVAGVRAAIDAAGHPALLMCDTIASLLTCPYEMDSWGVDVTIGAGQKGFMLPPGLGFNAVSPKAREVAKTCQRPGNYWDWSERLESEEFYLSFCGTAPEHMMFGLRAAIDMINEEGVENVFKRHFRLSRAVHAAVDKWAEGGALQNNAVNPDDRSNSVTTVLLDEVHDPIDLRNLCRERYNLALGNGMGKIMNESFRIGHMGDLNEAMIFGTLGAVEAGLKGLQIPHGEGGVNAAIDSLLESDD